MTHVIDFSIANGKIGAPVRRGIITEDTHAKRKLDLREDEARVKVSFEDKKVDDFAIPIDSTFTALQSMVMELTGVSTPYQKIFADGKLIKAELAAGDISSAGVAFGATIKVICCSERAVEEVHQGDSLLDAWDGVRGFEEEEQLERRRHDAAPMYAAPTHGTLDSHGFGRIEPLLLDPLTAAPYTNPPPEEAKKLLERLASDRGIQAIMQRRGWRVGLLTELPANEQTGLIGRHGKCLLGLNKNKGEEILLRLRTSDLKGFRPVYAIMETLVHELCHIVYGDHDAKFWGLFSELKKEAGSSDWTRTEGHALSGWAVRRGPGGDARRGKATPGEKVGHVLGGGGGEVESLEQGQGQGVVEPRVKAAIAAEERFTAPQAAVGAGAGRGGDAGAVTWKPSRGVVPGGGGVVGGEREVADAALPTLPMEVEDTGKCACLPGSPMHVDEEQDCSREGDVKALASSLDQGHPASEGDAAVLATRGDATSAGLSLLETMGFVGVDAEQALVKFHGSVERAADWLLRGGTTEGCNEDENCQAPPETPPQAAAEDDGVEDAEVRELRASLGSVLERLIGGISPDWAACNGALKALHTILSNILKAPEEEKYRRIKIANASFQSKVARHRYGMEFLEKAKFRRSSDGALLECARADAAALYIACGVIESAMEAMPVS